MAKGRKAQVANLIKAREAKKRTAAVKPSATEETVVATSSKPRKKTKSKNKKKIIEPVIW